MRFRKISGFKFHSFRRKGQAESLPYSSSGSNTDSVRKCTEASKSPIRQYTANVRQLYGYSPEQQKSIRSWLETYSDVQKFERFRGLKVALTLILGGLSACSIYGHLSGRKTLTIFFLFAASFIGCDIGRLWSRILADKSRVLIAASLIAWAFFTGHPLTESLYIAGGVTAFTAFCVFFYNLRWISAQLYKRSDLVQEALQKVHTDDFDRLWEGTGSKLVRSLWWNSGIDADNVQFDAVKKSTFLLGYSLAVEVNADVIAELDDLKAKNEALQADLNDADGQLDEMLDFFEQKEAIEAELAELRETKKVYESRSSDYDTLYFENERLKAQVLDLQLDLQLAKDELEAKTAAEPETEEQPIVMISDDDRREALLEEAYQLGYGVSRAMKHAGVSHWKAQKFFEMKRKEA